MRYFKKTFIWIIILVAIAGYSYMDFETTRIKKVEKEQAIRLLPFSPDEVISIKIKKVDGILEMERWEEGWRIIAPIKAKADIDTVEKFLKNVTASKNDADYVMDPDPAPERLVEFGLASPTLFVTLKVGKELTSHTLIFGHRAPTMGVAFAQLEGQKPVYRVNADARAEADKDVYYFRDKSVLRLNPLMLNQFSIKRPEGTIMVRLPDELAEGRWMLEKPLKERANHIKVFEVLGSFKNAEVKEFIVETKDDSKSYGLDNPGIELLFWITGDADPTIRMKIGNRSPEKRGYFASMSDRDNIFLLEEEVVNNIPRSVDDLRDRDLFIFAKDQLRRIEIRQKKSSIVLVKTREKEWRRNNVDGEKVDLMLVKDFLDELIEVKIEEFFAAGVKNFSQYGLAPARIKLLIWPEESAVPISLSIGKKTPTGKYLYARSGGQREVLTIDGRIETVLKSYF